MSTLHQTDTTPTPPPTAAADAADARVADAARVREWLDTLLRDGEWFKETTKTIRRKEQEI